MATRWGLTNLPSPISNVDAARIADLLFAAWIAVTLVWLVMVAKRRRRERARQDATGKRVRRDTASALVSRSPGPHSKLPDAWANSVAGSHLWHPTIGGHANTLHPLGESQSQTVSHALLAANSRLKVDALLGRPARPTAWTLGVLQQLEWRRFEQVCLGFLETIGYSGVSISSSPTDDASLYLIQHDKDMTHALVKTVAGNTVVDVDQIRALYAAMSRETILQGFCITAGELAPQALVAARGVGLFAVDGTTLLQTLTSMPALQQEDLLRRVFQGDYATPSCPSCGKKMAPRDTGINEFWRCSDYPVCKAQLRPPQASSQSA